MPEDIKPQLDRDLLERYLAGSCTGEELSRAQRMAAAHPEAWATLKRFSDILDGSADTIIKVNTRKSLDDLRQRMSKAAPVPVSHRQKGWTVYPWIAIAAAIVLAVVIPKYTLSKTPTAAFREQSAPLGQRLNVTLADGSRLILAPGSKIRYATDFGTARREIFLDGESYFDVRSDPNLPFTVFAGNSSTQVLGTSFVVRKYSEDSEVRVAVASGKVALSGAGTLAAGDVGTLSSDGRASVLHNQDTAELVAWTEGRLLFEDARLDDVLADLSRWYNLQFIVESPTLKTEQITIAFDKLSPDAMLKDLAVLLKAQYRVSGRTVYLSRHL